MRRYLLPDEVVTTEPFLAPVLTGEVDILCPVRNTFELLTLPVIEPSEFCFHCFKIGIPSFFVTAVRFGADFFVVAFGGVGVGLNVRFGAGLAFGGVGVGLNVRFGAGLAFGGVGVGLNVRFGADFFVLAFNLSIDFGGVGVTLGLSCFDTPPNNDNGPDALGSFLGAGGCIDFASFCTALARLPNIEKVPPLVFLISGTGGGIAFAFFCTDLASLPKMDRVPLLVFFFLGAGSGIIFALFCIEVACFPKIENVPLVLFLDSAEGAFSSLSR
mmetsp:Transcript_18983/g.23353  ORF Transcript_18983/g.23353 Transcript_18983/m.23353 type:complete len:272 (-) Transcript_18983:20-835(-)